MRGKFQRGKSRHPQINSFNEARALCAGSAPANIRGACGWMASMRPAHYAREVLPKQARLDPGTSLQ